MILGKGFLNWGRSERITDRYGAIGLWEQNTEKTIPLENKPVEGTPGKLIAKIIETRKSKHIGDIFHGIFPKTPEVGEEICLGKGLIFYEDDNRVGVKPITMRETFWMEPKKLYKAHSQFVELRFERVK